jgi:putative NADH-flavin reductase
VKVGYVRGGDREGDLPLMKSVLQYDQHGNSWILMQDFFALGEERPVLHVRHL